MTETGALPSLTSIKDAKAWFIARDIDQAKRKRGIAVALAHNVALLSIPHPPL